MHIPAVSGYLRIKMANNINHFRTSLKGRSYFNEIGRKECLCKIYTEESNAKVIILLKLLM